MAWSGEGEQLTEPWRGVARPWRVLFAVMVWEWRGVHFVPLESGRVDRDTDDDEITRSFGRIWGGICEFGVSSLNQGSSRVYKVNIGWEGGESWVPGGNEDKLPCPTDWVADL